MASAIGVKSRWLTDKETDNLSQIIHNFFMKSANIIVNFRIKRNGELLGLLDDDVNHLPETEFNDQQKYLGDLDKNSLQLHQHDYSANDKTKKYTNENNNNGKQQSDIWFNIKTQNPAIPKKDLLVWKNKDVTMLPPMIIETVLDLSELNEDDTLYIDDDIINTTKKSEIVLERWLIKLDLDKYDNDSIEIPAIYKNMIVMFRCLYTLAGLLPAYSLVNGNSEFFSSSVNSTNLKVKTKILDGSKSLTSKGRFGLSRPLLPEKPDIDSVESKDLLPILTPIGSMNLSVSFRKNCNFHIFTTKEKEEILDHDSMYEDVYSISSNIKTEKMKSTVTDAKDIPNTGNNNDIYPSTSPFGNIRFRTSSTSVNSQTSRRRASTRSVSIFKTGSMASSSPPFNNNNILQNNSTSPNQTFTSSYSNLNPIPVKRTDSTSSVHFYNNSNERNNGAMDNNNNNQAIMPSLSSRFASSLGSKFKNSSSRNNSLEGQLMVGNNFTPSSNPILQNFRSRNKYFASSYSDIDPSNSLYLDDDLNNFMKLLDSKPDLRVSNNSSIVYDDSLSNFKNLKKHNDLLSDSPLKESIVDYPRSISPSSSSFNPPPVVTSTDERGLGSSVQLLIDNKEYFNLEAHKLLDKASNYETSFSSRLRTKSESSRDSRLSRSSRDSRGSKGSRGSRESHGIMHGPLITSSSYAPNSSLGMTGQLNSQSIHSILKASATSGTSGAMATGFNTNTMEHSNSDIKKLSDSLFYTNDVNNKEKKEQVSLSPISSSLPRNMPNATSMNRMGPSGRAQTLLRSLSIGTGNAMGITNQAKSRTGSGGSIVGSSQLRNILHSSLRKEGFASGYSKGDSKFQEADGHITPEQLKDISYGREVFDSEDECENNEGTNANDINNDLEEETVNRLSNTEKVKVEIGSDASTNTEMKTEPVQPNRDSMSSIRNKMKNMQRRQSQLGTRNNTIVGRNYNHLRFEGISGPATLHSDELEVEDSDDEEDELLFEMSDMTSAK